ncbi:HNH endonuclease family protein, partial [Glutamicibacter sp. AOP12-B1-11]|uniref:HNH endonuclease family protein n=1 Tax=Glutamicibacter sp. AOP12-B1-11 TaxID=3457725 RepID=UPI0040332936
REVWQATFGDTWWRENTKQGRYLRPRVELFLMHWLTEKTNSEISATGLFVEFSRLFNSFAVTPDSVKEFTDALVADAGIYRSFHSLEDGTREQLFFARREVLDIGVIYPVALRLWRGVAENRISRDRLETALTVLESWLVRRMTLRLTNKNYNRIMLELLKTMDGAPDPVSSIITYLKSFDEDTPSGWWPSDEAFRGHLLTRDLYKSVPQPRVRMLLKAVESRLFSSKTEKLTLPSKLSIEHVIPQSWKNTWPLPAPATPEDEENRKNHIHRIGNLTLVTANLNPALGNDPWESKRKELSKHSALRLNALLVNDYQFVFDESSIDVRSSTMVDLLIEEWPAPETWM